MNSMALCSNNSCFCSFSLFCSMKLLPWSHKPRPLHSPACLYCMLYSFFDYISSFPRVHSRNTGSFRWGTRTNLRIRSRRRSIETRLVREHRLIIGIPYVYRWPSPVMKMSTPTCSAMKDSAQVDKCLNLGTDSFTLLSRISVLSNPLEGTRTTNCPNQVNLPFKRLKSFLNMFTNKRSN